MILSRLPQGLHLRPIVHCDFPEKLAKAANKLCIGCSTGNCQTLLPLWLLKYAKYKHVQCALSSLHYAAQWLQVCGLSLSFDFECHVFLEYEAYLHIIHDFCMDYAMIVTWGNMLNNALCIHFCTKMTTNSLPLDFQSLSIVLSSSFVLLSSAHFSGLFHDLPQLHITGVVPKLSLSQPNVNRCLLFLDLVLGPRQKE